MNNDIVLLTISDKDLVDGCFNEDVADTMNYIQLHVSSEVAMQIVPMFVEEGLYVEIHRFAGEDK